MPFLIPLFAAIGPSVLSLFTKAAVPHAILQAETLSIDGVPATGEQKKQWVEGFFCDLWDIFESRGLITDRYEATFKGMLPMISEEIERQLDKLKAKGKIERASDAA